MEGTSWSVLGSSGPGCPACCPSCAATSLDVSDSVGRGPRSHVVPLAVTVLDVRMKRGSGSVAAAVDAAAEGGVVGENVDSAADLAPERYVHL